MRSNDQIILDYIQRTKARLRQYERQSNRRTPPAEEQTFMENGMEYTVFQEESCLHNQTINILLDLHRPVVLSPKTGNLYYHRHTFFELFYVYQGSCEVYLDGEKHLFTQNQICLMNTNTLHTMHVLENSYVFNLLVSTKLFDETFVQLMNENDAFLSFFLDSIYNKKNKSKYYIFDLSPDSDGEFYLKKLISEHVKDPSSKPSVKKSVFICLLNELAEQYRDLLNQRSSDEGLDIAAIISFISQNYKTVQLASVAQQFHYTANSMGKFIKKQTGRSFSDLLRSVRLKRSFYLLSRTTLSIQEIANQLGYSERGYFEKVFKQYCGISPAAYRKQHSQHEPCAEQKADSSAGMETVQKTTQKATDQ